MNPKPAPPLELSLEPLDVPAPQPAAAASKPLISLPVHDDLPGSADPASPAISPQALPPSGPAQPAGSVDYLAQATREYEQGQIDSFLWTRALSKAGNDQDLARPLYLESRAIALRVLSRDKRASRGRSAQMSDPLARPTATEGAEATQSPAGRRITLQPRWAIAAAVVAVVVIGVLWFAGGPGEDPARPSQKLAAAVLPAPGSASEAAAAKATAPTSTPAQVEAANAEKRLIARVHELREAGNWNVLVLTANEWTRVAPDNPEAWLQLTAGYVNLHQYDEALEAARHALRLVPENVVLLRELAGIQQQRNDPEGALQAFQQVVLRDGTDAHALTQVGLLQAHLDRLPEARAAFSRALALKPDDPAALCGAASVAQREGRPKDADALARQAAGLGTQCALTTRHPGAVNMATQAAQKSAVRPAGR